MRENRLTIGDINDLMNGIKRCPRCHVGILQERHGIIHRWPAFIFPDQIRSEDYEWCTGIGGNTILTCGYKNIIRYSRWFKCPSDGTEDLDIPLDDNMWKEIQSRCWNCHVDVSHSEVDQK